MASPHLLTTPDQGVKDHPILIIDKAGLIGYPLAHALKLSFLPLLVTQKKIGQEIGMIHIPYGKKFPRLPNNTFSHIILVYSGEKEILKLLPKLLKKAAKSGGTFSLLTEYRHYSEDLSKKLHGLPFVNTFIYGDLFGTPECRSKVQSLLIEAKEKKKITLSDMGLKTRYPIHLNDLVSLFIATLLGLTHNVRTYFLASDGRTELSLLRMLQSVDPLITMDFVQSSRKEPRIVIPPHALHLFPTTQLHERLKEAMLATSSSTIPYAQSMTTSTKRVHKKSSVPLRLLLGIILLVCLPLLIEVSSLAIGYGSLAIASYLLQRGETTVSHVAAEASFVTFQIAEPSEGLLSTVSSLASVPPPTQSVYSVESGKDAAELLVLVSSIFQQMNTSLLSNHPAIDESMKLSLQKSLVLLQTLQARGSLPESLETMLAKDQQSLSLLTNTTDILPGLLGYSGTKTYAVLFQDNTELRPGGGLIRSFMTISLQNGKVTNTKIYDVYDTDSNLPGYADAPFLLNRYLKTAHLFLRDANMSEVSSENASTAAMLIPLETNKSVDGIITVDLSFFRGLLGLTGPLTITSSHTTVSRDTLFQQYEKSTTTLANSSAGASFLGDLMSASATTLRQKQTSALVVSRFLAEAIRQKHLLIYAVDPSIQKIVTQNRLDSSPLYLPQGDRLGIIESNLGANKTNYFLQRQMTHIVELHDDMTASESVKLQYSNGSNHDPLAGDYTAYLQLLVPSTARLQGITINNTPQVIIPAITDQSVFTSSLFKEPTGLEVSVENKGMYQLIGFPIKVKDGEQRELVITYSVPQALPDKPTTTYTLSYFKQPGVDSLPYSLSLSYPTDFHVVSLPSSAEDKKGQVILRDTLTQDSTINFKMTR